MTRTQWLEIAERLDKAGCMAFICSTATKMGLPDPIEGLKAAIPELYYALPNDDPEGGRLSDIDYTRSKVLLCCLFAAMSAKERKEWGL